MPLLARAGYAPKAALGLVTAAGLPGVLLLPALPLILAVWLSTFLPALRA
jgi:hypothetical protein